MIGETLLSVAAGERVLDGFGAIFSKGADGGADGGAGAVACGCDWAGKVDRDSEAKEKLEVTAKGPRRALRGSLKTTL